MNLRLSFCVCIFCPPHTLECYYPFIKRMRTSLRVLAISLPRALYSSMSKFSFWRAQQGSWGSVRCTENCQAFVVTLSLCFAVRIKRNYYESNHNSACKPAQALGTRHSSASCIVSPRRYKYSPRTHTWRAMPICPTDLDLYSLCWCRDHSCKPCWQLPYY